MTLDPEMAEIAKVFFQESREGLDVMESGLLSLGATTADNESINTIFRAAHSIKGGAATFGFTEVAGFTHGVETLLDEMRNGVRPVTADAVQVLLQSCDCLREMMAATEAEQPLDQGRIASLNADIAHILGEQPRGAHAPPPAAQAAADTNTATAGWRIVFEPVADLLRLRNEPSRMFAELARLGGFAARADVSRVPPLDTLDPESCYLSWDIEISGRISRTELDEVFDWVDSGCRLEFTPKADLAARGRGHSHGRAPRLRRMPSRRRTFVPVQAPPYRPPALRCKRPEPNPAPSAWPRKNSTTSSIWSANCSSRNPCSAASPMASARANWTGSARGCRSSRAIRASCRRA